MESEAVHADEDLVAFELQIRISQQSLGEVIPKRRLAAYRVACAVENFGDKRRSEFDIFCVVCQDRFEIMPVPGCEPFIGELLSEGVVHGAKLRYQ